MNFIERILEKQGEKLDKKTKEVFSKIILPFFPKLFEDRETDVRDCALNMIGKLRQHLDEQDF